MGHQPGAPPDQRKVERAIVFELLGDHDKQWSEPELARVLREEPSTIADAVARLQDHGVLLVESGVIVASPCARKIDALGVIGI